MPYRFREVRLQAGKSVAEIARQMEVTDATVRNWENNAKKPTIEMLCRLADYYGVTTDYLLGRSEAASCPPLSPDRVSPETLPVLHGWPVWDRRLGWGLVNAMDKVVSFVDGQVLPFTDALNVSTRPLPFMIGYYPHYAPLSLFEVNSRPQVWVVPVGVPWEIQSELTGWYRVFDKYVENEFGQHFYLDTYGSKWLAFECDL